MRSRVHSKGKEKCCACRRYFEFGTIAGTNIKGKWFEYCDDCLPEAIERQFSDYKLTEFTRKLNKFTIAKWSTDADGLSYLRKELKKTFGENKNGRSFIDIAPIFTKSKKEERVYFF
jgi:hypothetical protein